MATMSLDNQIKKYLPLLGNEEKQSLLSQIKSFLTREDIPKRMTKEEFVIQYNKDLDEAEKRVDAGFYTTQDDLEKESETW